MVSGEDGAGVAVLSGAVIGVAKGRTLAVALCEPLATDAVGSSDDVFGA